MNGVKILRHVLGWCMWFTVTSCFSFLWFLVYDRPLPIQPTVFSYLTLTLVFYLSYYTSYSYFRVNTLGNESVRSSVFRYLFSWRVIWLVLITGTYFILWWIADKWFVSHGILPGRQTDILLFMDGRFSRVCFYLAIPMYFAADDCLLAKKDKIIEGESNVGLVLMREMDERNEQYDKRLKEMEAQIARLEMGVKKNL